MLTTRARTTWAAARAPQAGDDEGMTLVELSVAMLVSIILLVTVSTSLGVFSGAETNVARSADAAAYTRLALLQLQNDIQSAVPVDPLPAAGGAVAYEDELQVTVQPSGGVITWQYNPGAQTLTRQVGSGPVQVELSNVTNGNPSATPAGLPVFHYFDHCGNDLVTEVLGQGAAADPTTIAKQATVVQVTLAVANLDSAPYGTTTSVNVMNRSPGPSAC